MNTEKYIEIPFLDKGRDFDGCDCWGLTKLVLENEFGKTLPDFFDYKDSGDKETIQRLINTNIPLLDATHKERPDIGDVALFRFYGHVTHIGVYIGGGRILHIMRGSNSVCEKINSTRLKGRLEGFYEINQTNYSSESA